MGKDEDLPIACPYCPEGEKTEFYDAKGVDSHFAFSEGHPTHDSEPFKKRIRMAKNQTSKDTEPPREEVIIEQWADNNYPNYRYTPEVPVRPSITQGNTKYIDIILYEQWPFMSRKEYQKKAIKQGVVNINTGEFRDKKTQVEFILNNSIPPVRVRVFEAKRKLNFKSIGQILAYSEFFPEYYSQSADIEVVEKGIIYGEEDNMCLKTAERYGISLYSVNW